MAQAKTSSKKSKRIDFGSSPLSIDYPDFLDIQLKSFEEFFQIETLPEHRESEGLFKVFSENFPITDTRNQFVLEFLDYFIDPPRYSIDECIERGLTYSVPLKAKLKLYCTDPEHEDFETIVQDVYLGQIPYMTPKGSFVVNGAERVVVSQLHRSPGCVLRPKPTRQRNQVVQRPCHPVQGILDRIRYGHQRCDVRVHRPEEEVACDHLAACHRIRE